MKKSLGMAICFGLLYQPMTAQDIAVDVLQKVWPASWITVPAQPAKSYGVFHFRKSFDAPARPTSFIIHVSADNRYKLFVNGILASLGPARGDMYHWNFETVDIAPFLKRGKNTLAAVVWNFGEQRPEAQISSMTAFIVQGNTEKEKIVNSDSSWMCVRDNAYSPLTPDLVRSYYVAGPGERINFNQYPSGWELADFDHSSWQHAATLFNGLPKGVFDFSVGWMLVPRTLPQMELTNQRLREVRSVTGIKLPANFPKSKASFTVPSNTKVTLLLDQGFLTNAYPVVQFGKGKDALISISYAEALYIDEGNTKDWRDQNKKGNRNEVEGKRFVGVKDECIANGRAAQRFMTLAWRTYRYMKVEIGTTEEALVIDDLYGIFTGYPFQMKAKFSAGDKELDKILETGWRTARLCAMETYMDCPYYEQLQYVGDTRIQALVSLYNTGDDRLMRNAINQLNNSRMPEGITLSRFPTANPQQIPTFSLTWIGMIHDYWMYRNDPLFVKATLPGMRSVLSFFQQYQQGDGSLSNLPYWKFTDWTEAPGWNNGMAPIGKNGNSAALDLQLLWAYQLASELEERLGMDSFAESYKKNAVSLKETILKKYWVESKKMFADTPEKDFFSQHTNTLAVLTEVLTGEQARFLIEKTVSAGEIAQATIYFKYYIHRAMAKVGLGDKYLDMLGIWKENLANGLTTWAEISNMNEARSDCHAWGASPNIEFFRIVLGIDAAGPGFSTVKIEPHLGSLKQASGTMPHPKGEITVNYRSAGSGKWTGEISLPRETSGMFVYGGKEYPLKPGRNTVKF